jgi:hypothetical protein
VSEVTLASYALASLEGAIILSRTARDVAPLQAASKIVADTLRADRSDVQDTGGPLTYGAGG